MACSNQLDACRDHCKKRYGALQFRKRRQCRLECEGAYEECMDIEADAAAEAAAEASDGGYANNGPTAKPPTVIVFEYWPIAIGLIVLALVLWMYFRYRNKGKA